MKQLKFIETIIETIESKDKLIKWVKNKIYNVTYEADDAYYLGEQNGVRCGIDKKSENDKYIVIDNKGDDSNGRK